MIVLSNCITDDIRKCKNCGLMMVWGLIQLFMVFYSYDFSNNFKDFINIRLNAN